METHKRRRCLLLVGSSIFLLIGGVVLYFVLIEKDVFRVHHETKGTLRKLLYPIPTDLDPATTQNSNATHIIHQIYDRLFTYTKEGSLAPSLVQKFEVSPNSKVYTFYIRKGVKFHDGSPLLVDDILFTFKRIYEIYSNKAKRAGNTLTYEFFYKKFDPKNIQKISDYVFTLKLQHPYPPFIEILANYTLSILPQKYVTHNESTFYKKPIGTGPYKLELFDDDKVILSANKDYFLGRPEVQKIIYVIMKRDFHSKEEIDTFLVSNKIDDSFPLRYLYETVPSGYIPYTYFEFKTILLGFNTDQFPFNDINIRKAFFHFFDRKKYNEKMRISPINQALYYLPYGSMGHIDLNDSFSYDPSLGYTLLKKSHIRHPKDLGLITIYSLFKSLYVEDPRLTTFKIFKNVVETMYKDHGFNLKIELVSDKNLYQLLDKNMVQAFHIALINHTIDPYAMFEIFLPINPSNWFGKTDHRLLELLTESQVTADRLRRNQLYKEANKFIYDDCYTINLNYITRSQALVKKDVVLPQITRTSPYYMDIRLVNFNKNNHKEE